jgi:menaquinone-dependent protoporphyrinogen oxidase
VRHEGSTATDAEPADSPPSPAPMRTMTPRQILIVYGTRYGQTAKIAERIADVLMANGDAATIVHAHKKSLPGNHTFAEFDGVIVGASVIRGRHQGAVARFVRTNLARLTTLPSAFFSVSGAAAGSKPGDAARAQGFVDEFLAQTRWRPSMTERFGGAMAYTKYGRILRWVTKRTSEREGGPTDTSRDHEFTDWEQVERFARAFARQLPLRRVPVEPAA